MLKYFEDKYGKANTPEKEAIIITETLKILQGTYGVWIVNIDTLNTYIARQGSTLFYDKNSFSSIKGDKQTDIKEGQLYRFNSKGIKSVKEFKSQSPFLEL